MRVVAFRVQNYRNIEDSGWVELDRVTALVGRNESGKTTLLKALHKFNPAMAEPYDGQADFPRDRYTTDFRDAKDWVACSVRFELTGAVVQQIAALLPAGQEVPKLAECSRYYDGTLRIGFDPPIGLGPMPPTAVCEALATFAQAARRLAAPNVRQEKAVQAKRTKLAQWAQAMEAKVRAHANLRAAAAVAALEAVKAEADEHAEPMTADIVEELQRGIATIIADAKREDPGPAARRIVNDAMPVFIYFENYGILDSAVWLPRFLEDGKRLPHDPRIRTINAMFQHVGLEADDLLELGRDTASELRRSQPQQAISGDVIASDRRRKDERAIKLSSASAAITRRFGEWWSQRRHRIRYDADGDYFRIWISDDRRPDVEIELESRSKGLQWFFSFYLVFLVESEEGHKDAVLLLDEPGLNLHPTAQQELLGFFERLSARNQLVYSTHSPFLIDGENLQRVRPVVEGEDGHSHISGPGMWPKDRETIFPLQAAAGYAMLRGLLATRDNVLVEGMTDYYLIHVLNPRCRAAGLPFLPESIHVVPCGGVPMVGKLASLFLGERITPLVLLDADLAGRQARTNLLNGLYREKDSSVMLLDEVLGSGAEIEDVLGEDAFVAAVNTALLVTIKVEDADRKQGGVVKAVASAAKRLGIDLPEGWKATTILHLVSDWAEGRVGCPDAVVEKASALFEAIDQRFAVRPVRTVVEGR